MMKKQYSTPIGELVPLVPETALLVGTNRADEGYDPENDLGEI